MPPPLGGPPENYAPFFSSLPPWMGHGLCLWPCRQLCRKPKSLELLARWRGEATDLAGPPAQLGHVGQHLRVLEGRHRGVDHRHADFILQRFEESVLGRAAEDDDLGSVVRDSVTSRLGQPFLGAPGIALEV